MLRKSSIVIAVVLLSAGLSFSQNRGQRPPASLTINGRILIGNRQAPERIEVFVEPAPPQASGIAYSDYSGNFQFSNLPLGAYDVVIRLPGFLDVRQRVDTFGQSAQGGSVSLSVFIELKRKPVPDNDFNDPSDGKPFVVDIGELQKSYPRKAIDEYEKGLESYRSAKLDRAVLHFETAIAAAPNHFYAHNVLGIVFQKLGRFADAEKEYRIALELNPRSVQTLANLGSLLIQESDSRTDEGREVTGMLLDGALDVLEEAVRTDRSYRIAYFYLGVANYKSMFFSEAERNLLLAREIDGNEFQVRVMLVNVYMKLGRWREAFNELTTHLARNPDSGVRRELEDLRLRILDRLEAANR